VVDQDIIRLLALERREQGGAVQPGLDRVPAGEILPELSGQAGVVADEVVEHEQARTALVDIPHPPHVARRDLVHAACPLGEHARQLLVGLGSANVPRGVGRDRLDKDHHVEPRRHQPRRLALHVTAWRGESEGIVDGDSLDLLQLCQFPGLPFEDAEELLLIPAPVDHRAGPARRLHISGQLQVPQRGGFDEVSLAVPRALVDKLNGHRDPLIARDAPEASTVPRG